MASQSRGEIPTFFGSKRFSCSEDRVSDPFFD